MKLDNYCKKLNDLVAKEINPLLAIADKLEEWYQGAQVAYVKPQLILSELSDRLPAIEQLDTSLLKVKEEQHKVWNMFYKEIEEHTRHHRSSNEQNDLIGHHDSPLQMNGIFSVHNLFKKYDSLLL